MIRKMGVLLGFAVTAVFCGSSYVQAMGWDLLMAQEDALMRQQGQEAPLAVVRLRFLDALRGDAGKVLGCAEGRFYGIDWDDLDTELLSEILGRVKNAALVCDGAHVSVLALKAIVCELCRRDQEFARRYREAAVWDKVMQG